MKPFPSLALVLLALLAGCAFPQGPARPVSALIRSDRAAGDRLEVRYDDGTTCRATVPATGGAGRLAGCPHADAFDLRLRARNPLELIFGAAVSPYATVTVTGATGSRSFRLPDPGR